MCVSMFLGCSFHQKPKTLALVADTSPLDQTRVFQKEKLSVGGNLLVVPFSAGENVEASDQLDRVSLMIVKGISDLLGKTDKPFKVLVEKDAQNADFVIKGRIVQMQQKSPFHKPWEKKLSKYILRVEGSVLGVQDDEILAKFSKIEDANSQTEIFETLGYQIGEQIGHFLLTSAR